MMKVVGNASTQISMTAARPPVFAIEVKWPKFSAATPGKTKVTPTIPATAQCVLLEVIKSKSAWSRLQWHASMPAGRLASPA